MMKSVKVYDCLVCETGEFRSFYHKSDADKFAESKPDCHVLRGISFDHHWE